MKKHETETDEDVYVKEQPSVCTYTGHGGHVQFISLVAVTRVTLSNADAPAVLTAVEYPTILCCAQTGVGLITP